MSAGIPIDDFQTKDSSNNCPQNAQPPYMDENLDKDTCPLISLPSASPQSQPEPDQYYPEIPNCPSQSQDSQYPANATVTVSSQQPTARRANRIRAIETRYMYYNNRRPNNYMAYSIFNLFCCSSCLGAIALYYSLRVNTEYSAGRYEEAVIASRMAKTVNQVSFVIGTVIVFFIVVAIVVRILANIAS